MKNINTILVAVDLSDFCVSALKEAARLAHRNRAKLHVVHVVTQDLIKGHRERFNVPISQVLGEIRSQVFDYSERHVEPGTRFEVRVEVGHAVEQIIAVASEISADLIVLGAHGQGRRKSNDIGMIAARCVRRAPFPVLLVRSSQVGAFRKVVAAVDFSKASRFALEQAAIVADRDSASLHVLHIHRVPWQWFIDSEMESALPKSDEQIRLSAELRQEMARFVRPVRSAFPELEIETAIVDFEDGVATEIRTYADMIEADLVVIGAQGRSGIRDLLLGTTAERFIHRSSCCVLTVRSMEQVGDDLDGSGPLLANLTEAPAQ